MGPPNVGKGTQGQKLQASYKNKNVEYLPSSSILKSSGALNKKDTDVMQGGGLITDDLVNAIISDNIVSAIKVNKHCILDGYPRTAGQLDHLRELGMSLSHSDKKKVKMLIIDIQVKKSTLIDRAAYRVTCGDGYTENLKSLLYGHQDQSFNLTTVFEHQEYRAHFNSINSYSYPFGTGKFEHVPYDSKFTIQIEGVYHKCPDIDGHTDIYWSRRADDKPQIISKRIQSYHDQYWSIINSVSDKGDIEIVCIDGSQTSERVYSDIEEHGIIPCIAPGHANSEL